MRVHYVAIDEKGKPQGVFPSADLASRDCPDCRVYEVPERSFRVGDVCQFDWRKTTQLPWIRIVMRIDEVRSDSYQGEVLCRNNQPKNREFRQFRNTVDNMQNVRLVELVG